MNEPMTDLQFQKILKMVLAIISKCKTVEDAVAEIKALLEEK
jgi:hypothetical protein